ncbi:hypothetical protein GUB10_12925 [Salegentibacter sp. BLCTC]|uniref:hypothetical protein n=1 Tax=Salegentibacter sp. BLCTC TaxID=2697368 RepID=UPI00187B4F9E|nr:hypothetical protein [Salegentibacter sp. BLCTC]MBE7641239.1 hypothetical protein [Salegentibacter sp. BLCTC]
MGLKTIYFSLLFLFLASSAFGQKPEAKFKEQQFKPEEKVFVDYNSSLVFPGEYLYYKVYVLNDKTNRLSSLSQIAYVKMVSENGETIFTHKINTASGTGNGDFFVPTNIASGTYKLIAFTEWMYNKSDTNFFSGTVFVINPYTTKGEKSLKRVASAQVEDINTISEKENSATGIIKLSNKAIFNKREEVKLLLDSLKLKEGNYSLSVYKKNKLKLPDKLNISNFQKIYPKEDNNSNSTSSQLYLPELRGDLFRGTISTTNKNLSVSNQSLAVSVPGDNFQLKISNTNEEGVFYFNLDASQSVDNLVVQMMGENAHDFEIELDSLPKFNYSSLYFPPLEISPDMESEIVKRSVFNQIENSYYSIKPDTLKTQGKKEPFFGSKNIAVYPLDDYTRFPTVKETFIEVISAAKIRENKKGESVFGVYSRNSDLEFISSALLLVDGLYIENTEALMNYSANKIDVIKVVRNEYYYGSKIFGGIISIETKENDFVGSYQSGSLKKFDIIPVRAAKNYYVVNYKKQELDRIPDFRRQLLWKPRLTNNFQNISFFTSDVEGDYIITLQGISNDGRIIFDQICFEVVD